MTHLPEHDLEKLKSELKSFHQDLIEAHLEKDLDFFVKDLSEDYFSVTSAEIRRPTREQILEKFEYYLGRTTFTEYHDLEEPVIGISHDGSLGWSLVRVKIAGKQEQEDGSLADLDFSCAWITLFERRDGKWLRMGEVSSF